MKKLSHVRLTVNILKQGNRYVVYSPALDLSTSGRSETEAKKRFGEMAFVFFEELDRAGTTRDVLQELGWRQARNQWQPSKITSQETGLKIPVAA